MPSAVSVREDYSAEELRTHARRSKDIDIAEVRTAQGKLYPLVAIETA